MVGTQYEERQTLVNAASQLMWKLSAWRRWESMPRRMTSQCAVNSMPRTTNVETMPLTRPPTVATLFLSHCRI